MTGSAGTRRVRAGRCIGHCSYYQGEGFGEGMVAGLDSARGPADFFLCLGALFFVFVFGVVFWRVLEGHFFPVAPFEAHFRLHLVPF